MRKKMRLVPSMKKSWPSLQKILTDTSCLPGMSKTHRDQMVANKGEDQQIQEETNSIGGSMGT